MNILKNLSSKENIRINLILSKIYMNIFNNESLYSKYLLFDSELFKFKAKTLKLITCIYLNCKRITFSLFFDYSLF